MYWGTSRSAQPMGIARYSLPAMYSWSSTLTWRTMLMSVSLSPLPSSSSLLMLRPNTLSYLANASATALTRATVRGGTVVASRGIPVSPLTAPTST